MCKNLNVSVIVNLVLVIAIIMSTMTGFRRGMLSTGRWLLGIIFGFLAVPLVSPLIEKVIKQTPLYGMFTLGNPGLDAIASHCLNIFVFSLSLVIVKKIVYILTDIDLPKAIKAVDSAAGATLGVVKICLIIWVFEWLLTYNAGEMTIVHKNLMTSQIYSLIATHSLLNLL